MARVRLLRGPERSERARRVDVLLMSHWDSACLIVPTQRYAASRSERLVLENDLPGLWGNRIFVFNEMANRILRAEGAAPRMVTDLERSLLLEESISKTRKAGQLGNYTEVSRTGGFAAQVQQVIEELKQAAVEPADFLERARRRNSHDTLDLAVAAVYDAYQKALLDAGFYDGIGLLWQAAVIANEKSPAFLEQNSVLLLDGFDDFTPSEFRQLAALEPHLEHLVIGLDIDGQRPSANDLYAVPIRTSERIRREFPSAELSDFDAEAPISYTQYAARELFWRDKPEFPSDLEPDLTLLPCAGMLEEIETAGRTIKRLLLDGKASCSDIAVAVRDLDAVAPGVRSVFGEFGIPVYIDAAPSLEETSLGAHILNLLEAMETWQRESLLDVLSSPWFGLAADASGAGKNDEQLPSAECLSLISRAAGIIEGREAWRDRVINLLNTLKNNSDRDLNRLRERIPEFDGAAQTLLESLEALEIFDNDTQEARTPELFVETLELFIKDRKVSEQITAHPNPAVRETESAALESLTALLDKMRAWHTAHPGGETLSRTEFARNLRATFADTPVNVPQPRDAVLCLVPERMRKLQFDYVLFLGVNDGVMPRPKGYGAVYSEGDYTEFRRLGIHFESGMEHIEREMLLFHHLLQSARKRLFISWRNRRPDGRDVLPSPFVRDVQELLGDAIEQAEIPPLPTLRKLASERDLRNAAFDTDQRLQTLFKNLLTHPLETVEIEAGRHSKAPFNAFDGMLADTEENQSTLARFGEDHVFSVAKLESYAECPFKFFSKYIFRIPEIEDPVEEFDAMTRGQIIHTILERFHAHFEGLAIQDMPENDASSVMKTMTDEIFREYAWRSDTAPPGVGEVERRRLHKRMQRYLMIESNRKEADWKPIHFEYVFGKNDSGIGPDEPVALSTSEGNILVTGRIDRIDGNGEELRIIDYKSGGFPADADVKEGRSLQLPLYALAMKKLFPEKKCAKAYFLTVGENKRMEAMKRGAKEKVMPWEQRREALLENIADYVKRIRGGVFPPTPATERTCSYCSFRRACRFERWRIELKQDDNQ